MWIPLAIYNHYPLNMDIRKYFRVQARPLTLSVDELGLVFGHLDEDEDALVTALSVSREWAELALERLSPMIQGMLERALRGPQAFQEATAPRIREGETTGKTRPRAAAAVGDGHADGRLLWRHDRQ